MSRSARAVDAAVVEFTIVIAVPAIGSGVTVSRFSPGRIFRVPTTPAATSHHLRGVVLERNKRTPAAAGLGVTAPPALTDQNLDDLTTLKTKGSGHQRAKALVIVATLSAARLNPIAPVGWNGPTLYPTA
jgi:hypothetical protein